QDEIYHGAGAAVIRPASAGSNRPQARRPRATCHFDRPSSFNRDNSAYPGEDTWKRKSKLFRVQTAVKLRIDRAGVQIRDQLQLFNLLGIRIALRSPPASLPVFRVSFDSRPRMLRIW